MANKVLKSIKFPGLSDTYTIPQVDNTLAISGAAADAKKTGDAIGDLKSAVEIVADASQSIKQMRKSDKYYPGILAKYPYPDSAFEVLGVNVYSDGKRFITDYNPIAHKNSGGNTYYYSPTGQNSNSGTRESPKLYPTRPYNSGDTHIFLDGVYARSSIPEINKSINIIAENPGKVIFKNSDDYTWSADGTVYSTTRTNTIGALAKCGGIYTPLAKASSLTDCGDNPLTWFTDGTLVYVNTGGLFVANNDTIYLNLSTNSAVTSVRSDTENINVYFEGVDFVGGQVGGVVLRDSDSYTYTAHFNNCGFYGAYTTQSGNKDALSALGGMVYLYHCVEAYSRKDGYNYHANNGAAAIAIEIDCIAHDNGFEGWDNTDNGSTCHDGGTVIRVNGVYYNNVGANVADVGVNTKTLNLNCLAFNSKSTETGYNSDFCAQQASAEMWLDGCKGYGSDWTIYAYNGTTMYVHDSEYTNTHGSGTIDTGWKPGT